MLEPKEMNKSIDQAEKIDDVVPAAVGCLRRGCLQTEHRRRASRVDGIRLRTVERSKKGHKGCRPSGVAVPGLTPASA